MFSVFKTCISVVLHFSLTEFFIFFCNAQLLYEKLESCLNDVDVRMVLCLFKLMNC